MIRIAPVLVGALLLSGCQQLAMFQPVTQTPMEQSAEAPVKEGTSNYLSDTDPLPVQPFVVPASVPLNAKGDPYSHAAAIMAQQMSVGLSEARVQSLPMTILPLGPVPGQEPYVNVGEQVAEALFFYLQANKYNLIDYRVAGMPDRAMPDVEAETLSTLRRRNRIYFVLTGNYARYNQGLVFNTRVLDTTTRQVLAAGQVHIPDQLLEGSTPGYDSLRAIEKGMIIETQQGPAGME